MDAAVRHVLWCFVLQTSMDHCTQLVLHPLRNVQPVQIVVQEMAESAVVLPRVAEYASGSIPLPRRILGQILCQPTALWLPRPWQAVQKTKIDRRKRCWYESVESEYSGMLGYHI